MVRITCQEEVSDLKGLQFEVYDYKSKEVKTIEP